MISPDVPITKVADDTLNRGVFAQSLATTILQYSFPSSFSIGLYGAWGSGKTSLLNMVLEAVEENDEDAVILRFNPWLCADSKQLITQFFKQLSTAIKLKKSAEAKAWEIIDRYADLFDVAGMFTGAGTILSAFGKIMAKEANEKVEQRENNLQEMKDRIISKVLEERLKIIVSIDDIDRLSEEEIIAVFQLVKSLADFPNTVYILAFDYNVVVRALGRVQRGDGKEYLEKIIQVPFEIPTPNIEDIHAAFFSKLETIIGDIPAGRLDNSAWAMLFRYGICNYINSIRDVIRYTNVFLLKYQLLKEETNLADLLGLTALQVFEPFVYSKLPTYKELLCGSDYNRSYDWGHGEEERIKKMVSLLIDDNKAVTDREAVNNILGILFPKVKSAMSTSYGIGRSYSHRDFLVNNNIAIAACFDRYFALSLENEAIPTSLMRHLIYEADEGELKETVMQLYHDGKIVRLLEEIDAYANRFQAVDISEERASLIIRVIVRSWSSFEVEDSGLFSIPFSWRLLFCVEALLKVMKESSRFTCMHAIFMDAAVQPSTLASLLHGFEGQHGRFTMTNANGNAILGLEDVLTLEDIFKQRATEAISSGEALQQYQGLNFLWLLGQIDAQLVTDIKKTIITDDSSLVKVISYCTSRGSVMTSIVTKTRNVDLKTLGEFIDVDEAYRRIKVFVNSQQFFSLPKDDQINVQTFVLIKEGAASEFMSHNSIAEDTVIKALPSIDDKAINE